MGVQELEAARQQARDGRPPPRVLFLGDSLTAGWLVEPSEAFPALLAEDFQSLGLPIRAVNAGTCGDTAKGGLHRIGKLLAGKPDVVVVELGVNDGLWGTPAAQVEASLREIIQASRRSGAQVLLLGMRLPEGTGSCHADEFAELYARLGRELSVPLVPFLLEGVAGRPALTLADGLHPNAAGYRKVAENVLPNLLEILIRCSRESVQSSAQDAEEPAARGVAEILERFFSSVLRCA